VTDTVILLLLSAAIPVALLLALAMYKPNEPQTIIHIVQPAPRQPVEPTAPLQLLPEDDE
jgi:hypothetical protein